MIIKKLTALTLSSILLIGCTTNTSDKLEEKSENEKVNIVATTTMLHDLISIIGSENVDSNSLMNFGVDPHLYKASAGDVAKMEKADVILYNGYHLEGEMGEVFSSLSLQGKNIICLENAFDETLLLTDDESIGEAYDPHIWFDVLLWSEAASHIANSLAEIDYRNKEKYLENLENYKVKLEEVHEYIKSRIEEVPENQRVLITAHDAFNYFGNAYGFQVIGLQGISTDSQSSTLDIRNLADLIVNNEIKAIFVESSVSSKNIEALQAAVKAKGFDVSIGGELYSDSLGDINKGHDTYIETVKHNVDTIVNALK